MTKPDSYWLQPIGIVRSALQRREDAPLQGREGGPEAWVEIYPEFLAALEGIEANAEVLVLTWLHLARRDVIKVRPRRVATNPLLGVFATRSPDRPNPIGLHQATVLEVDGRRGVRLSPMEAVNGTPVIDIKPVQCPHSPGG